jgi:Histidine kinase-, DNA gyrase B-, and HSP90-like ATPase
MSSSGSHVRVSGSADSQSLVHAALAGIAAARTPADAALAILGVCVDATEATGGRIHLLDLGTSRYVPFPFRESESVAPLAGSTSIPRGRVLPASEFRAEAGPDEPLGEPADGIVIFSFRGKSCVGSIALDGPDLAALPDTVRDDLVAVSDLLVPIYEDQFALNLFKSLQAPLDFTLSEEEFFRDVGLLIGVSSGMEFAALREIDDGDLRCIALWGMGDDADPRDWDLRPAADYPPFARAMAGETVRVCGLGDLELAEPARSRVVDPVRSIVATPVRVGTEIFGVLSVGARCAFDYAPLELRGFESIATGIGLTISNFRNLHELAGRVGTYREAALAITAIEVAQAARHEAAGRLDNCQWKLAALDNKLGRHASEVADDLREFSDELKRVNDALERIKTAARPPERTRKPVKLLSIWEEARTAVAGRLQELRISANASGPDVEVDASRDWLRQVFLNLLLNSIDAFKDAKRMGRKIELTVDRPSDRANRYELTYRDNATGINPQRLQIPTEYEDDPLAQVIFRPSVTSKRTGSGFGLWLVRRILDDHGGSIDLRSHRGGVTFLITLPKPGSSKP